MRLGDPVLIRETAAPIHAKESQKLYHKYRMTGQNEITDYRDARKIQKRFVVGGVRRNDEKRSSNPPAKSSNFFSSSEPHFSNSALSESFHGQHNYSNQLLYAQGYNKLSLPKLTAQSSDRT